MQILFQCKRIMSYVGLVNETTVKIAGINYPILLFRVTVLLTQFWIFSVQILRAAKLYAISKPSTLFALYAGLSIFIKLATYVVMLMKIGKIAEIFDYLQMVVRKRMFAPFYVHSFNIIC